ncbi:hypothetical protein JQ604_33945 [Bradyrhizobium jicamae]|nr:hypothetical protein [Bradyrhizobium jicamae]
MPVSLSLSEVPYGADQTLYLVIDEPRLMESVASPAKVEFADLEAVLSGMLDGPLFEPIQVVAFNTLEHWIEDVSATVAQELQSRCATYGVELPAHLADFVERSVVIAR